MCDKREKERNEEVEEKFLLTGGTACLSLWRSGELINAAQQDRFPYHLVGWKERERRQERKKNMNVSQS